MDSKVKPIFQSSVDPNKVSMTIQGVSKAVVFMVTFFAVQKGFDPTQATNGIQQITDLLIVATPAILAVYHTGEAIYGVVRKMFATR